jgi:hypothetical protein
VRYGWSGPARWWPRPAGPSGYWRPAAWSYPRPEPGYALLAGFLAFYPSRMGRCTVGGEEVRAQNGDFYGGWITAEVRGPFKGAPGTRWW